jgi:hypothetical protein
MEDFQNSEEAVVELCAGCGRDSALWRDPVAKDGERYCCAGCATARGCTCEPAAHPVLTNPVRARNI